MQPSIIDRATELLRRRGWTLVAVAVLALAPALTVNALFDLLGRGGGVIVNGQLVRDATTESWTTLRWSAVVSGGGEMNLALPVLPALGWLAAVAVGIAVLAGDPPRRAWRRAAARAAGCVLLGALLVVLGVVGLIAAFLIAGFLGGATLIGVAAALVCAYLLARLALALPVMVVEGSDLTMALRRAALVTQGRTFANGTALLVLGAVLPAVALGLAESLGNRLVTDAGGSWGADLVWTGLAEVMRDAVLVAIVPVQVALLVGAYLVAAGAPRPLDVAAGLLPVALPALPEPVRPVGPARRRLRIAALVVLVALPAGVTSAVLAANPRRLPVMGAGYHVDGFVDTPLAVRVLDNGDLATVESSQVVVCRDTHCSDSYLGTLPCVDGGEPQAVGPGTRMCSSEGPMVAADITSDGMLLMLSRGADNSVRLVWCRVAEGNPDGRCAWGGARSLLTQPIPWENWSMSIAATPAGGFAAAMLGPGGADDATHGVLLLVTCDRLDCPQPTVSPVLEIPLPQGSWGGGTVDIAVDQISGAMALGYLDPTTSTLWLGGCPEGCPDGPRLTDVTGAPGPLPEPTIPFLEVAATPVGPAAVVATGWTGYIEAVACDDLACASMQYVSLGLWTSAWPAVDPTGALFLVAAAEGGTPVAIDVAAEVFTSLVGEGEVTGAAFGSDGRLHTVLRGRGSSTIITLAA